jgi:RNA methyltransferase, TrmH family
MGLSKNQIKLIQSLNLKKQRQKQQLFVAEGIKVVNELLKVCVLKELFVTDAVVHLFSNCSFQQIDENELKKISSLKSPNGVLAIFEIPENSDYKDNGLVLALDDINDPGNLGTIIRLCDWFGVTQLVCSQNTVDCYNSKVVQATMGSIARVNIMYVDLIPFLKQTKLPTYIADMEGDTIYKTTLPTDAVLILGNEANGISDAVKMIVKNKITIPRFGESQVTESLNVATATAIILSEFRRS